MKITQKAAVMLAIYAVIIVGSLIYFVALQNFGSGGLEFWVPGRDNAFTLFDILIIVTLPIALVLLAISTLAFFRKPRLRLFLISVAFFFFAVKEALFLLKNFFPNEFIFIDNAERALEFLILVSFIFLMYRK